MIGDCGAIESARVSFWRVWKIESDIPESSKYDFPRREPLNFQQTVDRGNNTNVMGMVPSPDMYQTNPARDPLRPIFRAHALRGGRPRAKNRSFFNDVFLHG